MLTPEHGPGDKLYIYNSIHISRGSADVCGSLAEIEEIIRDNRLPDDSINSHFVKFKGLTSHYNYKMLLQEQEELKARFGNQQAHSSPDVNTPWLQSGDMSNGEVYHGPDVW